jgi:2-polyprenyl-6-methoxyphenol hydroxylase-like FAD-dependent oxidoreductase
MRDNAAKLLAIVDELRRELGPGVPTGALLRLAAHIIVAATTEPDELGGFGRPGESRPFAILPCDEAMEDGGWRVLAFERRRDGDLDNLDHDELEQLEDRLERFLGPEWQYRTRRD